MMRGMRKLMRGFRREDGTASIEFVMTIPILMTIFMASFESGMFMVRHVMVEQALDVVMRDLRLGKFGTIDHDTLRTKICEKTVIIDNCETSMKIELQEINTSTFGLPKIPTSCIDRTAVLNPNTSPVNGGSNVPMIVRVCVMQDPIFPMTGVGLRLRKDDASGGYGIVAVSVFANEPT